MASAISQTWRAAQIARPLSRSGGTGRRARPNCRSGNCQAVSLVREVAQPRRDIPAIQGWLPRTRGDRHSPRSGSPRSGGTAGRGCPAPARQTMLFLGCHAPRREGSRRVYFCAWRVTQIQHLPTHAFHITGSGLDRRRAARGQPYLNRHDVALYRRNHKKTLDDVERSAAGRHGRRG